MFNGKTKVWSSGCKNVFTCGQSAAGLHCRASGAKRKSANGVPMRNKRVAYVQRKVRPTRTASEEAQASGAIAKEATVKVTQLRDGASRKRSKTNRDPAFPTSTWWKRWRTHLSHELFIFFRRRQCVTKSVKGVVKSNSVWGRNGNSIPNAIFFFYCLNKK